MKITYVASDSNHKLFLLHEERAVGRHTDERLWDEFIAHNSLFRNLQLVGVLRVGTDGFIRWRS